MNRLNNSQSDCSPRWDAVVNLSLELTHLVTNRKAILLPVGQLPTPAINVECDAWLEKLFTSNDPTYTIRKTPDHLRCWIAARLMTSGGIASILADSGRDFPSKSSHAALLVLTTIGWNDALWTQWRRFYYETGDRLRFGQPKHDDPDIVSEETALKWFVDDSEVVDPVDEALQSDLEAELDDSADADELDGDDSEEEELTWEQLYDSTEMLISAVTHKGKYRLPVGKLPTPEIDKEVDAAFEEFFASTDAKIILRFPVHLKPWMGARLAVGTLTFKGASMQGAPFTFDSYADALRAYVVEGWYGPLRELWLKFSYDKKGKLEFRYEGNPGAGFEPN